MAFYLVVFGLVIYWLPGFIGSEGDLLAAQILLLFLVLLPLLNAPLDWLSMGVTRGLLYEILHGRHSGWRGVFWSVMDLLIAMVFLLLMAGVLTVAIILANWLSFLGGGHAVFDLQLAFSGLRNNPAGTEHWWLYAMLLTTLLPTLLHFVIAAVAFVLMVPRHVLNDWAGKLEALSPTVPAIVTDPPRGGPRTGPDSQSAAAGDGSKKSTKSHTDATLAACFYLTCAPVLGLLMPVAFLGGLFWLILNGGHGVVGTWLLNTMAILAAAVDPFLVSAK